MLIFYNVSNACLFLKNSINFVALYDLLRYFLWRIVSIENILLTKNIIMRNVV